MPVTQVERITNTLALSAHFWHKIAWLNRLMDAMDASGIAECTPNAVIADSTSLPTTQAAATLGNDMAPAPAQTSLHVQPQWLLDSKKQLAAFNSTLATLQGSLRSLQANIASMHARGAAAARAAADAAAARALGPPDSTAALPPEALQLVLSMLGPRDIAAAACCDCRWRAACSDSQLWAQVAREQWVEGPSEGTPSVDHRHVSRVLSCAFAATLFLVDAWLPSGDCDRVWYQFTKDSKRHARSKTVQVHSQLQAASAAGSALSALHLHFPHLRNAKGCAAVPSQRQSTVHPSAIWRSGVQRAACAAPAAKPAAGPRTAHGRSAGEHSFRQQLLDCLQLTCVAVATPLQRTKLQQLLSLGLVPTLRGLCEDEASSVRELAARALTVLLAHTEHKCTDTTAKELRLRNTHAALRQHLKFTLQMGTPFQGADKRGAGALPSPFLAALLLSLALPPAAILPTVPWLVGGHTHGAAQAAGGWMWVYLVYPSGGLRVAPPPSQAALSGARQQYGVQMPEAWEGGVYDGAALLRLVLLEDGTAVGQGFDGRPFTVFGQLEAAPPRDPADTLGPPLSSAGVFRRQLSCRLALSCCYSRQWDSSARAEVRAEQEAGVFAGAVPASNSAPSALASAAVHLGEQHLHLGSDFTWEVHCDSMGGLIDGRGGVGVWRTEQAASAVTAQHSVSLGACGGGQGVGTGHPDAGLAQLLATNAAAGRGGGGGGRQHIRNAASGGAAAAAASGGGSSALGLIRLQPCA